METRIRLRESVYPSCQQKIFKAIIYNSDIGISYAVDSAYSQTAAGQPSINDPKLKAELVFQGLQNPTSMAFLGLNDILVLEKDQGTVQRIVNGNMLSRPVF
jgi:hypothetical protein